MDRDRWEVHSLVAVKLHPTVKIKFELKFIFAGQDEPQDWWQLTHTLVTVKVWRSIINSITCGLPSFALFYCRVCSSQRPLHCVPTDASLVLGEWMQSRDRVRAAFQMHKNWRRISRQITENGWPTALQQEERVTFEWVIEAARVQFRPSVHRDTE